MSVAEAARKSGFSESTVRKKLSSGAWEGRKVKGKWDVIGLSSYQHKRVKLKEPRIPRRRR